MNHQNLTINHRLESWVYPNAAARNSALGFVAADVGRIAYQSDTGQYWRLTSITPTWQILQPTPTPVYASLQTPAASPVGTSVASPGVMMGLGIGHTLTPTASGKVFLAFSGSIGNGVAAKAVAGQIRYGTGAPPANGAPPSGTVAGGVFGAQGNFANETAPLSGSAVLTGLTPGVAYWFDLQLWTAPGGIGIVAGVGISAIEVP